jgi:hypothetical protein
MAPFDKGQNKKQELPIKKSSSNGVTAGETVTRPIHKRTIHKGPLPLNKDLHPFVQQHAAGDSDDQRHERWPPSFPHKKQHQRKDSNTDPLSGTEVGECMQDGDECWAEALMKPRSKLVIGTTKWIGHGQWRHRILGEKKCVCHKSSGANLYPISRKSTNCVNKSRLSRRISLARDSQKTFGQKTARAKISEFILAKISLFDTSLLRTTSDISMSQVALTI